ncbi:MAG TPA: MFS transporter [Candidatus Nanoarchaeia archaeon]|nr:MFS transporter [Candidatus Nanoarchaeia archaeon]
MKNLFAKDEFKILGLFYIERFIAQVVFFAPAFLVVFFDNTLTLAQIGILYSALAIATFVFEVPTGAFADIFGRKISTLFSYLMMGIILPFFIVIHKFYLLLLLFIAWGIAGTFNSGAREAWTIDNLKYYKRDDLIKSYYLKEYSISRIALFLSGLLGSFVVVRLGLNAIWIFASLSWIISLVILLPMEEHKLTKERKITFKQLYRQSKEAIRYSVKHAALVFILLATFFIMFRDSFGGQLVWQPLLLDLGTPLYTFGLLFSVSMLLGSIAPVIAVPMLKKCKNEKNYLIILLIAGILLDFSVAFVNSFVLGIILMLAILFLVDLSVPISDAFTQKFISSKTRATILSFKSMIISLAYAISYPLTGFIADTVGTQNTIVIGGLFLIPAVYCYWRINPKIRK